MTRFRLVLVLHVALAGCDADTTVFADTSASASSSGGNIATSTTVVSSASAGGTGGIGHGGQGGTGGIPVPDCPPPPCPAPGTGWNCDPACGAVEAWCDAGVCDDVTKVPVASIPEGTWQLRLPPITAQHPNCAAQCALNGTWWGVRFDTPDGMGLCVNWNLPVAGFAYHTQEDLICPSDQFGTPTCSSYSLSFISDFHLLVGVKAPNGMPLPDGGALITFYTYATGCANPSAPPGFCQEGCNGVGDEPSN